MNAEIKQKVILIISRQLGSDKAEVHRGTSLVDDLKTDCLDTIELQMEFEDEFGVRIPDEVAERLQTVGEVIDYIHEALTRI